MPENLLTNIELAQRIAAAKERELRARRNVRRLQKELAVHDKRRATQRKMILGYAVLRAAESCGEQNLAALRRLVLAYVTRDADREALAGTPFAAEPLADGAHSAPSGGEGA